MSTQITTSPRAGILLVDSQALRLWQAISSYQSWQVSWLIDGLAARGFDQLSATHITFISALDCADNIASDIARRLKISRQAVHKTVRELSALGYVATMENPDMRNSKVIQITQQGEHLVAAARQMFADLDAQMSGERGVEEIEKLIGFLRTQTKD